MVQVVFDDVRIIFCVGYFWDVFDYVVVYIYYYVQCRLEIFEDFLYCGRVVYVDVS